LFGSALDFQRDPLTLLLQSRERYGDVVRYRFGPIAVYQVSHPDGVKHVLVTHRNKYHKGIFQQKFKLLGGEGLLSSEDEFWFRQRRLAQPAFHWQRLAALVQGMTEGAQEVERRWETFLREGHELEITTEMTRLTLQIVGRVLLSTDLSQRNDQLRRNLLIALEHIDYRMSKPFSFPEVIPTRRNRRFIRALSQLDAFVFGLIRERRAAQSDMGDLLAMLLLAHDEETGETMSDRQVRDEVMTILLAGHETSGVALAWTWYLLSQHLEVERRLHAELDAVLGGRTPSFDDLPQLRYTRMVIEETLRLYPPAWGIARQSIAQDEIGGYHIPKGVQLMVSQYVTHRHPDFWERPEAFEPERFRPECTAKRPKFAYYPFGGGPRVCIGNQFALMEMQLILATLAQRYQLSLVPGHRVEVQPLIILRPRYGMRMMLRERQ
jgi:cytochrome P450